MARTIEQIEASIIEKLKKPNEKNNLKLQLSTSVVAEWKLWMHCFAYVIHSFEIISDI